MPLKCCVATCRGNYKNGPSVTVFQFPKDEELRNKWIHSLKRKDGFTPSKHSRVCEKHFRPHEILHETEMFDEKAGKMVTAPLTYPRLKLGSVPSQFPDGPSYLTDATSSTRESPDKKKARLETTAIEQAIQASLLEQEEYELRRKFCDLSGLKSCLEHESLAPYWTIVHTENSIMFLNFDYDPSPNVNISVIVDSQCSVSAYVKNVPLLSLKELSLPKKANNINDVLHILDYLKSTFSQTQHKDRLHNLLCVLNDLLTVVKTLIPSKESEINFLLEQLRNLNTDKRHHRYSPELMVFFSLLQSISPHAYNFLRNSGNVIIPHPHTLNRLCSKLNLDPALEQFDTSFLSYIKQRSGEMEEKEKIVSLMVDEVHLNPYFDFKGGNLCGSAYNNEQAATSAFVFMVHSLLSTFKDVVHILPVKTLSANDLHSFLRKVVIGLEALGLRIIVIVTDNNAINKKAVSLFSNPPSVRIVYQNPADPSRPLFFIIDSVHILKCIRNNWLNQKNDGQCMFYPNFDTMSLVQTASFANVKNLHELESSKLVKYGYGLTLKALFPTNLERQNVKLALQVFDSRVAEALMILGKENKIVNAEGTSEYIKIICNWWSIVNVKVIFKGIHKNNVFENPLTARDDDVSFLYLHKFLDWLDAWKKLNCTSGGLTKETHFALSHTTYGLLEMCKYCAEEHKFQFFLPGKIQTDLLENRFGKYRQLAGGQHNISVRQVYETETKLRLQSFLPCMLNSAKFGTVPIHLENEDGVENNDCVSENCVQKFSSTISVSQEDVNSIKADMPLLAYIAGYCCYSVLKKLRCKPCKSALTINKPMLIDEDSPHSWIKVFDRGLLYPSPDVLNAVVYCYIVVQKLVSKDHEQEFLFSADQRSIAIALIENQLRENLVFLDLEECEEFHKPEQVLKDIVRSSVNIFLNNYCKKKNDTLTTAKIAAKRKIKTLNK